MSKANTNNLPPRRLFDLFGRGLTVLSEESMQNFTTKLNQEQHQEQFRTSSSDIRTQHQVAPSMDHAFPRLAIRLPTPSNTGASGSHMGRSYWSILMGADDNKSNNPVEYHAPQSTRNPKNVFPPSAKKSKMSLSTILGVDTPIVRSTMSSESKVIKKNRKSSKRASKVPTVFNCNQCFSSFKRRYDLSQHFDAVHLKLQPFKCPECPKSFAHNGTMKKHVRTVHRKEKPFKCGVDGCEKRFSEKGNLNKHIMRKQQKKNSAK